MHATFFCLSDWWHHLMTACHIWSAGSGITTIGTKDYPGSQKIWWIIKLPVWLVSRWKREATRKEKQEEKKNREFKTSMTFINADLLCNPVSSFYAVKKVEPALDNKAKNWKQLKTTLTTYSTTILECSSDWWHKKPYGISTDLG